MGLFTKIGWIGLILLGILDSSFLFMPLGNDLLIVALTARRPAMLPFYAAMATLGSVCGCLLVDLVSRKAGEAGLENYASGKRLDYVKRKVKKSAAWALGLAALMPPPFPFTVFVIAAGAFQYPRKKMLSVIALARLVRFSLIGLLSVFYGKSILRLGTTPAMRYAIIGLVVISIGGSAFSIYKWVKQSRPRRGQPSVDA